MAHAAAAIHCSWVCSQAARSGHGLRDPPLSPRRIFADRAAPSDARVGEGASPNRQRSASRGFAAAAKILLAISPFTRGMASDSWDGAERLRLAPRLTAGSGALCRSKDRMRGVVFL